MPRLLDLYCCEGGAGWGYHKAGFEVVGVDNDPKVARHYPLEFHLADALEFLAEHGYEFDAIHASPPCQGYSIATVGSKQIRRRHSRVIPQVREALIATGKPYVIENVTMARAHMLNPTMLCWSHFAKGTVTDVTGVPLRMERHRLFESNIDIPQPGPCFHPEGVQVGGAYGAGRTDRAEARYVRRGGYTPTKEVRAKLLGITWMTQHGLSQSIPPSYTRYIGGLLLDALN